MQSIIDFQYRKPFIGVNDNWTAPCKPGPSDYFVAIFQVAQNPMKFVMLTLSVWKNVPVASFFKQAEKYGETGVEITLPTILISLFPLHQASQWASQVNSVLTQVTYTVKYTVHACSWWGVWQCRIRKDRKRKLHSYQRPWWSCEAAVQCPQNVGSSRCGD